MLIRSYLDKIGQHFVAVFRCKWQRQPRKNHRSARGKLCVPLNDATSNALDDA
ncbi:hypothetical protein NK6_8020 [Bradyrhizobium diazoefficiens]|uniref:Uncharacterized protein n=1 Tax=Bradyrhizobium diazoefficiens TaxID=1355477 RepID=A0A0E3VWM5_9BRAD|nr:hypothetical protein NK6_8020 [Bradyrhizobium diazoefficiens]